MTSAPRTAKSSGRSSTPSPAPRTTSPCGREEDLAREMEEPNIIDSVNALHRAGPINRTSDGYVFATRAAVRQIQIIGRVG